MKLRKRTPNEAGSDSIHRRLIGRRFDDETVKKDIATWPFKVVDKEGSPFVQVGYLNETKTFSPQEISAMVLTKVMNLQLVSNGLLTNIFRR